MAACWERMACNAVVVIPEVVPEVVPELVVPELVVPELVVPELVLVVPEPVKKIRTGEPEPLG